MFLSFICGALFVPEIKNLEQKTGPSNACSFKTTCSQDFSTFEETSWESQLSGFSLLLTRKFLNVTSVPIKIGTEVMKMFVWFGKFFENDKNVFVCCCCLIQWFCGWNARMNRIL